ncbi:MAG: TrkA C-terminal domain-containing protein [Christensenella sp.]|uniref:cation:proton antiporter regulatory subunit n=1 Tax=Christensenella sp. TaxID=1935934 RepID=UPI002B1F5582|nr:TrkA C-terminal domain-containing protein [Christensenella sp.]MEA5004012.1 TrkA C-terminal domain-containing protein [Christensenella sp.]
MSVAMALFFAVTVAYILIIDIFTFLFRMTGMTEEKAKFQVISLLTNSGFTTKESELVVGKLLRRKLARTVMLFGYVFSVTIITVFVNVVLSLPRAIQEDLWTLVIILAVIFVAFMLVKKVTHMKVRFNALIEKLGQRWMFQGQGNIINVMDEYARGVVAGVDLKEIPQELDGKTLLEAQLTTKYGLHIVMVKRNDEMLEYITKDTILAVGDQLLLFGRLQDVFRLFSPEDAPGRLREEKRALKQGTKENKE